jgi:hypothetical protein
MHCESRITLMGGGQRGEDVTDTEWGIGLPPLKIESRTKFV